MCSRGKKSGANIIRNDIIADDADEINSLPHDKILDLAKLKEFADIKTNVN